VSGGGWWLLLNRKPLDKRSLQAQFNFAAKGQLQNLKNWHECHLLSDFMD
jgi:hypothetical protein